MNPQRLAAIDALFAEALELPREERDALLEARAAADPELRREVEALLAGAERSVASILDPVRAYAAEVGAREAGGPAAGEVVGAYRLVRRLGEGGMGVVFLAERVDGSFERQVALKLLRVAGADPEAIRRFEQERRILARFEHPRIARLFEGGVDRRGLPYLVMEHVEGLPIDRHADARRLPIEARIALLAEVAEAVQAAHRSLIVHRDLKPSNVLVTEAGEVKLLDFGIAKILDSERGSGELTLLERRAMTPTYASPEQVNGEPISTASDVYQLGLLLYELLTGLRPQAATTSSLSELVELVCRREPAPPSRAVVDDPDFDGAARRAEARATTPAKLARRLSGELDAIVARAIAKAPGERYATPDALAADLARFLEGRPVAARRASLAFRVRKWIARNAAVATLGAAVLLAVVGYAVTVTVQSRAIDRQRTRAEREAATASAVERFLVELFEGSDPRVTSQRDLSARELMQRGAARVDGELADQPEVQARLRSALGRIHNDIGEGEAARTLLRDALSAQVRLLGEENVDVAQTRLGLSAALWEYGDRPAATKLVVAAVESLRRLVSPHDPRLARALEDLGQANYIQGDFDGGAAVLRESLEIHRANGSKAGIARALSRLGALETHRREFAAAEPYARESLEIRRELYGERSVEVAGSLYVLGAIRRGQREFESALGYFEQAAAIDRELLGSDNVELGKDLNAVAMVNQQLGRLDRADVIYAESLSIFERQVLPDQASLVEARQGLGALRVRQRRFTDGESILRGVVVELRKQPGQAAERRLRLALLWLGRSLAGQERRAEAIATWRDALAIAPGAADDIVEFLQQELEVAETARSQAAAVPSAR